MILKSLFKKIEAIDGFFLNVGRIHVGWMQLQIGTTEKSIYYDVSYVTDALNELLSASLFLFTNQIEYKKHYRFEKDEVIVSHDLEGGSIDWYILKKDNKLYILIWEDIKSELLDLLHQHGLECSPLVYDEYNLTSDLLFAIEITLQSFGRIILNAFKEIDGNLYAKEWGYPFPNENLNHLDQILKSLNN